MTTASPAVDVLDLQRGLGIAAMNPRAPWIEAQERVRGERA